MYSDMYQLYPNPTTNPYLGGEESGNVFQPSLSPHGVYASDKMVRLKRKFRYNDHSISTNQLLCDCTNILLLLLLLILLLEYSNPSLPATLLPNKILTMLLPRCEEHTTVQP